MNKTTLNSQKEKHSIANFYPRSPCGERPYTLSLPRRRKSDFYPRSPCGERLHIGRGCVMIHRISIHALLAESDTTKVAGLLALIYISIHALLAESDGSSAVFSGCCTGISIHALLAESDADRIGYAVRLLYFYPRSPCGERRPMTYEETIEWIFLSTLSLRRATGDAFYLDLVSGISIHALLAESDVFCQCKKRVGSCISIHALLAESDNHATLDAGGNDLFLSTLSLRRATVGQIACGEPITAISIHALLAESDGRTILSGADISDFYPRSPCGERPALCRYAMVSAPHFYPRSPCGERPGCASGNPARRPFLSTLSLRRATFFAIFKPQILTYFYPRSPCGERRHWQTGQSRTRQFLSTLSLRRATVGDTPPCCGCMISIHALLAESDLTFTFTLILLSVISIHALLAESDFKANVHRAKSRLFLSTLSLRRATILCVLPVVQHTDFYPRSPCGERP